MRLARFICAASVPLLITAGCTATDSPDPPRPAIEAPALRLVSYDSCEQLHEAVRTAAKRSVRQWGWGGDYRAFASADGAREMAGSAAPQQQYSDTNTHEQGVDEPDLVKTDGRRIVTLTNGWLRVVDAATKRQTGALQLPTHSEQMLLLGDRALVISYQNMMFADMGDSRMGSPDMMPQGTSIYLVDLTGSPRLISQYEIDASVVDARQNGGIARLVVRSSPRLQFPWLNQSEKKQLAANRKVIDEAPLEAWLPKFKIDGIDGRVDCGEVSRPDTFSGTSLVTVLSFDLRAATLGDGDPVAVLADAQTIYSNGPNLYLAHDDRWRGEGKKGTTQLFQFDVTGRRPLYVAGGSVPGWLLNQYSLSEHGGVLRAATTSGELWDTTTTSESAVYTLRRDGGDLRNLGEIGGLGKTERIYSVRFVGPIGYVVTFRQTDPLYTIDLSDPAKPRVVGELKIPGYSAYLHPVDAGRLIGVGQDANDDGRVTGLQVSLFDVSSLQDPRQVAKYTLKQSSSEAEYDPHAFLYWPAERLLVMPVWLYDGRNAEQSALLLRITDSGIVEIGRVSHGPNQYVRRSLVIGDTLWTLSNEQLLATSLDGRQQLGSVRF